MSEAENWSEAWARAEAKAEAVDAAKEGLTAPKDPKPSKPKLQTKADKAEKAAKVVKAAKEKAAAAPEEEEEEASPKKEEAAPQPVKDKEAPAPKKKETPSKEEEEEPAASKKEKPAAPAEEEEPEEEEEAPLKPPTPEEEQATLEALAKKLGYRIEGAAVTTDERVGFRAEKRRFREKRDAEEQDFHRKVQAAERYFEPALKAKKAVEAHDYDQALRELGVKGGLAEANDKYLEGQSGKDPRVSALEAKLAEAEARERSQREEEATARARMEQERAEREAVGNIGSELSAHPQLKHLSGNEWFAKGVLKVLQDNWDGYETLSVEAAAYENIQLLRNDPRAKMAYEALSLAFGGRTSGREAVIPERQDSLSVRRSDETSVRLDDEEPSKTLPRRKAAEARAPHKFESEDDWKRWATAKLRAASQ